MIIANDHEVALSSPVWTPAPVSPPPVSCSAQHHHRHHQHHDQAADRQLLAAAAVPVLHVVPRVHRPGPGGGHRVVLGLGFHLETCV